MMLFKQLKLDFSLVLAATLLMPLSTPISKVHALTTNNPENPLDNAFTPAQKWVSNFGYNNAVGNWRVENHPRYMADVNADGRADVVGFGDDGVLVSLSTGTGFTTAQNWVNNFGYNNSVGTWRVEKHPRFLADVNADGMADVVGFGDDGVLVSLSTGSGFTAAQNWVNNFGYNNSVGTWRVEKHPRFLADVNADHKADVVGFGDDGVLVSLSTGTGFTTAQNWVSNFGYNNSVGTWRVEKHPRFLSDVNGDGRADVVGFGDDGVLVSLSTGTGFSTAQNWVSNFGYNNSVGTWRVEKHPRFLSDVNGDGRADVVGFGDDGVLVSLSTGTGFTTAQNWVSNFGYNNSVGTWRVEKHPRFLSDVNGDGRADVIGFGDDGVLVSLSTGTGFTTALNWVSNFGYNIGVGTWRVEKHPRYLSDVNGDGRADVIGFGDDGVLVSPSQSKLYFLYLPIIYFNYR